MAKAEQSQQMIIEAQDELIKALSAELRKLALKNLRLKTHMRIIAGTPYCRTAEKIRSSASDSTMFSESIINLN